MKRCLIVINDLSGGSCRVDESSLRARFSGAYETETVRIKDEGDDWSADGFDLVVAAGGDGTFSRALNICAAAGAPLIYYGAGTFNECAKAKRGKGAEFVPVRKLASLSGRLFGYVAAAGTFTPLGYTASPAKKKKLGVLAYILNILREYRVYDIPAKITADGRDFSGRFTLIMAIDSARCFGFRFNRLYKENGSNIHLLLIRSPGKDSLLTRAKIFFPFFRAFFVGFGKEVVGKNLVFVSAERLTVTPKQPAVFNVDGDALPVEGDLDISVISPKTPVYIGDMSLLK